MAFGDVIARLSVQLGLETAAFDKGAQEASTTVGKLQATMKGAASAISSAVAGFVGVELFTQLRDMTQAAVDSAGGLAEQAAQVGATTTALQEYRYAATQVGLSSDEMDGALAQLTRRLGEAAGGARAPSEALTALGVSLRDSQGNIRATGDIIPLIADGLARLPDDATRAAFAVDLFGKAGQKLAPLLSEGSAGVNNLRQAAHDLGIVLSESDIARADEVADKVAQLRYVMEAQQNKKLLENADALLKYEQGVSQLKMGLIEASSTLDSWADQFDAFNARNAQNTRDFWSGVAASYRQIDADLSAFVNGIPGRFADMASRVIGHVTRMVTGIQAQVVARLNAVWAGVKAKVDQVRSWFFGLYDAVVGNSYIPDMVDEIGQHMRRLDAEMVAPAQAATGAAAQAFRDMQTQVAALLDRLFPEIAARNKFADELALLDGQLKSGALSARIYLAAVERLRAEMGDGAGIPSALPAGFDPGALVPDTDAMLSGLAALTQAANDNADGVEAANVRVIESWRETAEQTIGAVQRMVGAIKGGNLLDILGSVINVGMQLASIGVFGKSAAASVNSAPSIPRFANGTRFAPGGLALVGERGPELVNLPRGSRVTPNNELGGFGRIQVVPSPYFDVVVDGRADQRIGQAAPAIAVAGSSGAQTAMVRRRSRSLAA